MKELVQGKRLSGFDTSMSLMRFTNSITKVKYKWINQEKKKATWTFKNLERRGKHFFINLKPCSNGLIQDGICLTLKSKFYNQNKSTLGNVLACVDVFLKPPSYAYFLARPPNIS